jgi:hypothetical protein
MPKRKQVVGDDDEEDDEKVKKPSRIRRSHGTKQRNEWRSGPYLSQSIARATQEIKRQLPTIHCVSPPIQPPLPSTNKNESLYHILPIWSLSFQALQSDSLEMVHSDTQLIFRCYDHGKIRQSSSVSSVSSSSFFCNR